MKRLPILLIIVFLTTGTLLAEIPENGDIWISCGANNNNQSTLSFSGLKVREYCAGLRFNFLRGKNTIDSRLELLLGYPILEKEKFKINILLAPGMLGYEKNGEDYFDFTGSIFTMINYRKLYLTPNVGYNFNNDEYTLGIDLGLSLKLFSP